MSSSFEFGDWIFLLTSVFEMLMFCGFQSGWSSLVYVLVEEEIYSHLCIGEDLNPRDGIPLWNSTNSTSPVQITRTVKNNCIAQQEMLNLAYTLATSVSSLVAFPTGVAMDRIGPRFTRIISGCLLGFSSFLLSYLDKQKPGLLFVGLIVACISNLMMFMTPQACMQRFKKGRSVLVGLYCGAWGASSLTFLGFKVLYEHGGVGLPHFFRFLSVGCVFLCINAALLYPDSAIPPAEEKSKSKKDTVEYKHFKKHDQLSYIREKLKKYKVYFRHVINGRTDTSLNSVKSERVSERWNQLIPNVISSVEHSQKATDLSSSSQTDEDFCETRLEGNGIQLTRAEAVLDLSKSLNLSLNVLGTCCDIKKVTYAECPSVHSCSSQKDNVSTVQSSDLMKLYDQAGDDKSCRKIDFKTPKLLKKACKEKEKETLEPDQIPRESKDPLDSRSTDLQVWTANSAASYLKSGISFKHCVASTLHILAQVFITVCKIRTWFFVGTFSNFISDLSGGDRATVATYVNIFGLSHIGALVMAPLFGYIIDRQCSQNKDESVKPSQETEKQHQKFMMDIEASPKAIDFIIQCNRKTILKLNDAVLVTASTTVLFCLLTLIPNLLLQIVTFQLFVFVKLAYDTIFASILIIIFPQNHLGKLMGLAALIGAIFSLVQYPLFVVMEVWFGGRTIEVNIVLWLLCLLAFGFPIYLWRKASKQEPHSLALVAV